MSSLAQQLQRLAVPQTSELILHDKERKSLLFDPKEAANLDKETFYALGINGLDELSAIQSVFRQFESSLFNENAQNFQRAVQTKEVNMKLDETISEFLLYVSPYFLLKPAQKCLEWLIYRYQIHRYNTDSLMRCILPYHESKIFVRALQLFKLNSKIKTMWDWLLPIQESGVYLPRSTLINHCGTNPAFLAFISDLVPRYIQVYTTEDGEIMTKQLRVVFSFYSTTIIGVLENRPITEKIISGLIPYLTKGLKSPIKEYKAASYMITAQLLYKTQLQEKLLTTLLNTVSKYLIPSLLTEGIMCILVMFQTQENIQKLTKKSFKYLSRQNRLVTILDNLSVTHSIDALLKPFLLRLITAGVKQALTGVVTMDTSEDESGPAAIVYLSTVREIMSTITLNEDIATEMASDILESYVQHGSELDPNDPSGESLNLNMKSIVSSLETRYPAALDAAIEEMRNYVRGTDEEENVNYFLRQSVVSVKRQFMPDSDTNLFLCLNHPSHNIRSSSVQHLLKNLDECEDKEFVSEALLSRLVDDSPQIVQTIFKNIEDLNTVIIDKHQLQRNLLSVLKTHSDQDVKTNALKTLANMEGSDTNVTGPVVLSYFCCLVKKDYNLELLEQLAGSPLFRSYLPLKDLQSKLLPGLRKIKTTNIVAMNIQLAGVVSETLLNNKDSFISTIENMFTQVESSPSPPRLIFTVFLILLKTIHNNKDVSIVTESCLFLVKFLNNSVQKKISGNKVIIWRGLEDITKGCMTSLNQTARLNWSTFTSILSHIVDNITIPNSLHGSVYWQYNNNNSLEDKWLKLVIRLLDTLLELAANSAVKTQAQELVLNFIRNKFADDASRFALFGLIWTEHINNFSKELGLSATLQARVLQLTQIYIKSLDKMDNSHPVIINLLCVCTCKHPPLREVAVNCLNIILHTLPDDAGYIRKFLRNLLKMEEEIVNDPDYIIQTVKSISLKTEKTGAATPSKRRKSASDLDKDFINVMLNVCTEAETPSFIIRAILNITLGVDNWESFSQLVPLLNRYLSDIELSSINIDCLSLVFNKYTPTIAVNLSEKSTELKLLVQAMTMSSKPYCNLPSIQELALAQITREFYDNLPSLEAKHEVFESLTTSWLNCDNINIANTVKRIFKHVTLQAETIIEEMTPVIKVSNANTVREAKKLKRQNVSEPVNESIFETERWKRVVIILEGIQEKKKIENAIKLVPVAFQLLSRILDCEDHINGEYIKQLTLSTLYYICSRYEKEIKDSGLQQEQFNLEKIVQCIRTSDNPQTHHHALLVLTIAAKIQPAQLLHNVMSVFTFMGANTLRQDNAYSFHIISQILENVIPVITMACEEKSKSTKSPGQHQQANKPEQIIGMILRIFVDAYPHIPEHRKLMLFSKLINIVNPDKYLWHCLLLFIEHAVVKGRKQIEEEDADESKSGPMSANDLEFILRLATSFPVTTQIMSSRVMIGFIASLPVEKDDEPVKQLSSKTKYTEDVITDEAKIFNISTRTAKQLRHFKYATFYLLCQHLQHDSFLAQVARKQVEDLLPNYQKYLERVLQYLSQAARNAEQCQNKQDAKFHKVLLHKVYDLLDKVVSLLPDNMFVQVVSGLMSHEITAVQRKSMELLNTKLHQLKENQTGLQVEMLLPLVEKLHHVTKITLLEETDEEMTLNGQTAMYSLKLLCRMLGTKHPTVFVEVLRLSSEVLKKRRSSYAICATVLLCISELCSCLKIHVIQYLPMFLPQIIDMVSQDQQLLDNELLTLSYATALLCVVQNLSQFLSPYLLDILNQVCRLSHFADDDNPQRPQLKIRLQQVRHLLAASLPSRVILPCLFTCYEKLVQSDWECLVYLMSILSEHISQMKKEDLDSYHNQLLDFFFKSLDFRVKYSEKVDETGVTLIEDSVIKTITRMVMKMSEASFRPMMFKIFDWSTRDSLKDRILVLYRLSDYLVETLRSLFMIVAGPIVNYTAVILDANNSSKTKERYFGKGKRNRRKQGVLLSAILDCLSKCFLYDNEGFLTKDRFDVVMQPLVDQIENLPYIKYKAMYTKRISDSLVPCIANLAKAAHDDSLWKKLNYQILLKTRHSSELVRMAALEVEDEFHKKLGEDFMTILPETIPFLAELMEDDSEEVEKKCHQVIVEMEKTLGEPLQKYFK